MSTLYVTLAALKATLNVTATTWDADLTAALNAACRSIDQECGRRFYQDDDANSVRYYDPSTASSVIIDDLTTLTSVAVDPAGGTTFGTTWTSGTNFDLAPYNAAADGWPYTSLELRSGTTMPGYTRSIRVTGKFGWPTVPSEIVEATSILAGRLFKRSREAPLGVYGFGADGSTVRISRTDPDVCSLVEPYSKRRMFF